MSKKNPMARDLRTSKYKKRVVPDKKKYKRKPLNDPFKDLVLAIQKKTTYPDRVGKGVVKGDDVASMRDIINNEQGSKDA
jgi:hypothetical protein|tara:strand:- start:5905 stop:6144 length:240 start_codon:yes stop_codon:yes gene_type:complete